MKQVNFNDNIMYGTKLITGKGNARKYLLRNSSFQLQIPVACTHGKPDSSRRFPPTLSNRIPDREIISRECDDDLLSVTRFNLDVIESLQNRGWFTCISRVMDIQLRYLQAGP